MQALNTAIDAVKGVGKLAEAIGVGQSVVSNWRARDSVPAEHCAAIEQATKGAVRRWDLRPDDWFRIWPELKRLKGAPPVPTNDETKEGA